MDDVQVFHVTVPSGVQSTAPQVTNLTMPARKVIGIEIVVPDGARGNSGIALGAAGTQIIPSNNNTFIVSNNEIIRWGYARGIDSGAWQAFTYNVGTFPHTYEIRFLMNLLGASGPLGPFFLDPATLSSSGG